MPGASDYHLLLKEIWPYGLVFTRWLVISLLTPGMGVIIVNSYVRILFVLSVSVCITPALQSYGMLNQLPVSAALLIQEGGIGIFLGMFARLLLQMLEVTGAIISHQAALSNVFVNQPVADEQSSLPGTFLYICMLTLIFVNDFHHAIFRGIVESYRYFPAGGDFFIQDMSQTIMQTISQGFMVAIQISSPFLILGTVFFLTMGLLNRLMPQVHIFFISQPLDILLSFLIFISAITNMFTTYVGFLFRSFNQLGG